MSKKQPVGDAPTYQRLMSWAGVRGWNASDLARVMQAEGIPKISAQVLSNWKKRGIPRERYLEMAGFFGRTAEELAGTPRSEGARAAHDAAAHGYGGHLPPLRDALRVVIAALAQLPAERRLAAAAALIAALAEPHATPAKAEAIFKAHAAPRKALAA